MLSAAFSVLRGARPCDGADRSKSRAHSVDTFTHAAIIFASELNSRMVDVSNPLGGVPRT